MTACEAYACGRVAYARDAFDGLHLMDKVTGNGFDDYLAAIQSKRSGKARNTKRTLGQADKSKRSGRWTLLARCGASGAGGMTQDVPVPCSRRSGARG